MSVSAAYSFASNATLQQAAREKLPQLTMDDPLFDLVMPIEHDENDLVMWDVRDDIKGLMEPRTLNAEYGTIQRTGAKRFTMAPSYWGNKLVLTEEDLTRRRQIGTFGTRMDISRAQADDQDELLSIAIDRIRYTGWQFALNGYYYVSNNGQSIKAQEFTIQTLTSSNPVNVPSTATPLADLREIGLKGRGNSADFGAGATILMNRKTLNAIFANSNAADLGKYLVINGGQTATPLDLTSLNRILLQQNLPQIREYEGSYLDSAGAVQMFIPDGKAVVVARRPDGEVPLKFVFTANLNNMSPETGQFHAEKLSDLYYSFEWKTNPIRGISTMGFNGGLTVPHPKAMLSWTLW